MKTSDYVIQELKKVNDRIFMIVGGGAMHLNDSVGRLMPFTCTHHEQAAAIAAEGYARMTGKPGLCLITSGPGVTNAITGLYGAWGDSIPMIFISGQMKRETLMPNTSRMRMLGEQEVKAIDLVSPLTKFAIQPVPGLFDIKYCIQKAIYKATTGRPGPVWIDIPLDIQAMDIEEDKMGNFIPPKTYWHFNQDNKETLIKKLQEAKCPLIIAGHGIRLGKAIPEFLNFIYKTHIPWIPSINFLDMECPRRFGPFGTNGTVVSNRLVQDADLLLILGCRMNIRQVGYEFGELGKNAYKVMVDIDPEELTKKTFKPDLAFNLPIKDFLQIDIKMSPPEAWLNYCEIESQLEKARMPIYPDVNNYINPYKFTQVLNRFLKPEEIIVMPNGMIAISALQMLNPTPGMRILANSGAGSMGYGLPMAIGAALSPQCQGRRVICFEGDGSIQMNIQELQTVVYNKLPLKIFVLNDDGYASIKNTQDRFFEGRHVGTDSTCGISFPDMKKIADAYGIPFFRAFDNNDLYETILNTLKEKGPVICELMAEPNFRIMPKGIAY